MKEKLFSGIQKVERLAKGSKLSRLLHNPFKYIFAIGFSKLIYPLTHKKTERHVKLFTGQSMKVLLPSSLDIYLTGGKTDQAEIRLAKFIIRHVKEDDHFLDVGAHYGYFSLLAAAIAGKKGKIIACEPSGESFRVLNENAFNEFTALQMAISDSNDPINFYEFPNLFSEYNTMYPEQYEQTAWIRQHAPVKTRIPACTIDELTGEYNLKPALIKIDTEGAEYHVIKGASGYLQNNLCFVIMEYLSEKRGNSHHKKAVAELAVLQYFPHKIEQDGSLFPLNDIDTWLLEKHTDSDNIVFIKNYNLPSSTS